jgi:hypothetical protein
MFSVTTNYATSITWQKLVSATWTNLGASMPGTGTSASFTSSGTTGSITLNGALQGDSGTYRVQVTGCGTVSSATFILTVDPPLALTSAPASTTTCPGYALTWKATATGAIASIKWYRGAAQIGTGSTLNYTVASSDNGQGFSVVVTDTCGETVSANWTLTLGQNVTLQAVQASSLTPTHGTTLTLTIPTSGTVLGCHWQRAGSNLADGTNAVDHSVTSGSLTSTLTITNIQAGEAGNYDCVVTSFCNGTLQTSNQVSISVK